MTDNLFSAVSNAIYGEFGDGYTIYAESVEQGLNEPCFFIQCIRSSLTRRLGEQFFRENLFCIQFFPKSAFDPVRECHAVSERLMICLEYIDMCGSPLRGRNISYEVSDGVLNFFVNFDLFMHNDNNKNAPNMERLEKITTEVEYGK